MIWLWYGLLAVGVFLTMEGVAWATHRYVMHGWGWGWHRSHHEPREGAFELNDMYAVVGCIAGTGLFLIAWASESWWVHATAAGVTAYGIVYAIFHDGLVHQRWPFRYMPKGGYLRRLIQAHRLHHATQNRGGAVSFGFLVAPDPRRLHEKLKAMRSERAGPRGRPAAEA